MTIFKSLAALLFIATAHGLDIKVTKTYCESNYLDLDLTYLCSESKTCTMGEEATLEGTLTYTGLEDLGLTNEDSAYISGDMTYLGGSQSMTLFEPIAFPLCNDYMAAADDNEGDCPADGSYDVATNFQLPSPPSDTASWAATGWSGKIILKFNSSDAQDLGECYLEITTLVTSSGESNAFQTPSAKTAALIAIGVLAALGMCMVYCCCCRRPKKGSDEDAKKFTRMDNDHTTPQIY